ncbi:hypothetical protein GN109_12475 [Collimonas pratensis]|uniref:RipA family octameric membrane protein n=1 Tax=Collimonas pratensis TaxID=279113 RepID=UPI00143DECE8|nr:hypothetical protein [Collimonas pratensis]NKI70234.1 hypothetical protein [Collimonas pratensis]
MPTPEIDKSGLFNEIADGQVYPHNEKWYSHLLDQYKLYVEMADRISSRRAAANSYFLSINSAILGFVGYLTSKDSNDYLWLLAIAGATLSYFWHSLIRSYKNLNTAKWLVVHKIESRLPISPYDAEWEAMGRGNNPKLYKPITHIELGVPYVFIALHAVVFFRTFPYWGYLRCGK